MKKRITIYLTLLFTFSIINVTLFSADDDKEEGGVNATITPNITKAEIDKVMKENWGQFRYCYQVELTKTPHFYGKLVVRFTIGTEGKVVDVAIKESTLTNTNVEQCILNHLKQISFPTPRGGGIAKVEYPFIFKPSRERKHSGCLGK